MPLPTAQPSVQSVDYDGRFAVAEWTPAQGATEYLMSVLEEGAASPIAQVRAPANATGAVAQPAISDTSKKYTVVVQAMVSRASGPPTTPLPLFQPAFFVSAEPATQYYPYLNPAWSLAYSASTDIVVYLPELAASGTLKDLPRENAAFILDVNKESLSSTNYPYTLAIPKSSPAWNFSAAPIRTGLRDLYVEFLKDCEENAKVSPLGTLLLQQVVSRAMPQTFQETLYYAYGLNLEASPGYADLRPGLILRVCFDQYSNPASATQPWLTGYVGSAVVDYDIASYLGPQNSGIVGFDSFIAQLTARAMKVDPPRISGVTESGVADSADLFYPAFRTPFYRLFFPELLESSTGVGTVTPETNFTIASASTYKLLTTRLNYPTGSNTVAYFRGRAITKLCIRVFVNEVEEVVPVGTTVGNILDRYGWRPPATGLHISGLRLQRSLGAAVFDPTLPYDAGRSFQVQLAWTSCLFTAPAETRYPCRYSTAID